MEQPSLEFQFLIGNVLAELDTQFFVEDMERFNSL